MAAFLDTNILLRHLLQDHEDQSPRATDYLGSIERGEVEVETSDIVVFETVYVLERSYRQPKTMIRDIVLPLLELPGIVLRGKRRFRRVFDIYVERNLPFADAYHVALMEQRGLAEIVSFDTEFDRIEAVHRIEP